MSGKQNRQTRDDALADALRRIRVLERLIRVPNRMPWVLFQGNLNGETVPTGSDYFMPLSGLLAAPENAGGNVDSDVYQGIKLDSSVVPIIGANEPFAAVKIMSPGLYWVQTATGWFEDWGKCRCLPDAAHDDGDFSLMQFVSFQDSLRSTYIPGPSPASGTQIGISYDEVYAIDDRAVNPRIRTKLFNSSGTNRTFNNTTRVGGGGLFIIRLSQFPDANPPLF